MSIIVPINVKTYCKIGDGFYEELVSKLDLNRLKKDKISSQKNFKIAELKQETFSIHYMKCHHTKSMRSFPTLHHQLSREKD